MGKKEEKEILEYIENMSDSELNDFIFFCMKKLDKTLNEISNYLNSEEKRIKKALHEYGNGKRNEYTGILLGKSEMITTIKRMIKNNLG